LNTVGADFTTTNTLPTFTTGNTEIKYVPGVSGNRSLLFGRVGYSYIVRTGFSRNGSDQITGAGTITHVYTVTKPVSSFNYKWDLQANDISHIYFCSTDSKLYKYNTQTTAQTECPFPKTSAGAEMFSCYGYSMHWNASKTNLIFPVRQNGNAAVAEYEVARCL
jgi:hypothetical protein